MIKVEIDWLTADNIFCVVLKQQYDSLSPSLGVNPAFSMDKEENELQFQELKKAFELVMDHNGVKYGK